MVTLKLGFTLLCPLLKEHYVKCELLSHQIKFQGYADAEMGANCLINYFAAEIKHFFVTLTVVNLHLKFETYMLCFSESYQIVLRLQDRK